MITVYFNRLSRDYDSIESFGKDIDEFDLVNHFELWLFTPDGGPSICMRRENENSLLMYLRHQGDPGFVSLGDSDRSGYVTYTLNNGQTDEYPMSYCIPREDCYKGLAYFFASDGQRPLWLKWASSEDAPA